MEYVNKLAVFCAALLVAAVSGLWVIRGFAVNSKYYKETAVITSITDFSTEHSNYSRILPNGEKIKVAVDVCPKAFVFSVLLTVLCAGYTIHAVFIYSGGMYFAGLAEFFAQFGSIVLSFTALIVEIIVWTITLKQVKTYSNYE